jgi:hypothetical protein
VPVILPTPEEIAKMTWRDREKASLRARRTLEAIRTAEAELDSGLDRLWDSAREGWAEEVRTEANRILARIGFDPEAARHRAELLEADPK